MKHSAVWPRTHLKNNILDITGQFGAVDTFIVIKTNKQDCVWAPCTFVSIFLVFISFSILYVISFFGIFNIY